MQPQAGYLKIYRRIFSSSIWYDGTPFDGRSAWIDLLGRACYMPTTVQINGIPVELEAGDLIASERQLAQDWAWNRYQVRAFINEKIERGKIFNHLFDHLKRYNITVLTIANYANYNFATNNRNPVFQPPFQPPFDHPSYIRKEERKEEEKKENPPLSPPMGRGGRAECAPFGETEEESGEGADEPRQFEEKNEEPQERAATGARRRGKEKGGESVATCGFQPPSLEEWRAHARSLGWTDVREIDSSWGNYTAGGWKQKNGLPICDWQAQMIVSRNWWDAKKGRMSDETLAFYLNPNKAPYGCTFAICGLMGITPTQIQERGIKWANIVRDDKPLAIRILRECKDYPENKGYFK